MALLRCPLGITRCKSGQIWNSLTYQGKWVYPPEKIIFGALSVLSLTDTKNQLFLVLITRGKLSCCLPNTQNETHLGGEGEEERNSDQILSRSGKLNWEWTSVIGFVSGSRECGSLGYFLRLFSLLCCFFCSCLISHLIVVWLTTIIWH